MKMGVVQPLVDTEMHPGDTVKHIMNLKHPMRQPPQLNDSMERVLKDEVEFRESMRRWRQQQIRYWRFRAERSKKQCLEKIGKHKDSRIRDLYLKMDPDTQSERKLGSFFHYDLLCEMASLRLMWCC